MELKLKFYSSWEQRIVGPKGAGGVIEGQKITQGIYEIPDIEHRKAWDQELAPLLQVCRDQNASITRHANQPGDNAIEEKNVSFLDAGNLFNSLRQ